MNTIASRAKVLSLIALVSVGACGEGNQVDTAISALSAHYAIYPPNQRWEVGSIKPGSGSNQIDVVVRVTSDTDLQYIKTLSRMEQFAVAKRACPILTPELNAALGKNRVWVRLHAQNKELTASICPTP